MKKDAVGRVGQPFEMVVERGKVREFARAIGATDPAYVKSEEPVAPPTFLATKSFWEEGIEDSNPWHALEIDQKRGLHAEQEYIFHGPPPRAGTVLVCRSRIEEVYEKQGRKGGTLTFAVMVTEYREKQSGRLVAEARLTGVETSRPPSEE